MSEENENIEAEGEADESVEAPKPLGGVDPEGKPDWAQDKFWDQDMKTVRAEVLSKSFNELEGKLRSKTDDLKEEIKTEMLAAAPDEYTVNVSEDLKIPDDVEFDLTKDDPMVGWFFEMAKESGFTQETADKWLNGYIAKEMAALPDRAEEIAKLGDHGQDRMMRVNHWMESKLSADQFKSMSASLSSAEQVEALETLMKSSGPADFEGDTGGPAITLEELQTMQNDPRYWQSQDKAFIKKVSDGFARLYKNG